MKGRIGIKDAARLSRLCRETCHLVECDDESTHCILRQWLRSETLRASKYPSEREAGRKIQWRITNYERYKANRQRYYEEVEKKEEKPKPVHNKATLRRYRRVHADRIKRNRKEYYREFREGFIQDASEYYRDNRKVVLAKKRQRYKKKEGG